jgi:hypothetical protein
MELDEIHVKFHGEGLPCVDSSHVSKILKGLDVVAAGDEEFVVMQSRRRLFCVGDAHGTPSYEH